MKKSVWQDLTKLPEFKKLKGDKRTDVLIIGGGLSGLLTAYFLKEKGIDYILVEADKIASGITKNTTAKITSLHGLIYNELISSFGVETAKAYLSLNQEAIDDYTILSQKINCDFEKKDAYTYSLSDREKIEREVKAVNLLGFDAKFKETDELPFKTKGAICFSNQAQFNPLKFIKGISKDLNIYEDTLILDIAPGYAKSDSGKIYFKKAIICTHFPFINKHGNFFLKLYQHRSYVSAYEYSQKLSGMYVDEDLKGLSFRTYNGLLLIGGGSHRTGKDGGAWHEINEFKNRYYAELNLKYQWATQDCMSLDSMPYIGQYSKNTPDIYVSTGFNKWGMTWSMASAKMLSNIISGEKCSCYDLFSPQRSILKPQLFVNGFESAVNLLTPATKRCPHLGCALKWNKHEHTWDCPCHGSRFDSDGTLIDNPATGDAKIKTSYEK